MNLAQMLRDSFVEVAEHRVDAESASFVTRRIARATGEQTKHFAKWRGVRSRSNRFRKGTPTEKFAKRCGQHAIDRRFRIPADRRPELGEHASAIKRKQRFTHILVTNRMRKQNHATIFLMIRKYADAIASDLDLASCSTAPCFRFSRS